MRPLRWFVRLWSSSRFLEPLALFVVMCIGIVPTVIDATHGKHLSVIVLAVLVYWWMALFTLMAIGWRSSTKWWKKHSDGTHKGWEESISLTGDLARLLGEALASLDTYDRETADDIARRAQTVSLLRLKNYEERDTK